MAERGQVVRYGRPAFSAIGLYNTARGAYSAARRAYDMGWRIGKALRPKAGGGITKRKAQYSLTGRPKYRKITTVRRTPKTFKRSRRVKKTVARKRRMKTKRRLSTSGSGSHRSYFRIGRGIPRTWLKSYKSLLPRPCSIRGNCEGRITWGSGVQCSELLKLWPDSESINNAAMCTLLGETTGQDLYALGRLLRPFIQQPAVSIAGMTQEDTAATGVWRDRLLAINQDTQQKVVVDYVVATVTMRNMSNVCVNISLYDMLPRKDYVYWEWNPRELGNTTSPIDGGYPKVLYEYGLRAKNVAFHSDEAANKLVLSPHDLGTTPFQSSLLCKGYKIVKVHKFKMDPGEEHTHHIKVKPSKLWDMTTFGESRNTETNRVQFRGMSPMVLVHASGCIVTNANVPTPTVGVSSTASGAIAYVTKCAAKARVVQRTVGGVTMLNRIPRLAHEHTVVGPEHIAEVVNTVEDNIGDDMATATTNV